MITVGFALALLSTVPFTIAHMCSTNRNSLVVLGAFLFVFSVILRDVRFPTY